MKGSLRQENNILYEPTLALKFNLPFIFPPEPQMFKNSRLKNTININFWVENPDARTAIKQKHIDLQNLHTLHFYLL